MKFVKTSSNGPDEPRVYRVTEITRIVKRLLENEVGEVWIEGELSNVRRPSSGHYYCTIKDERSQIAAVMFRGRQAGMRFQPRDGLVVRVFGQLSVYERSGQYQVIVYRMEPGGEGALQAAFEALKKKLQAEGLFDPAGKRSIPLLPRHIGVITSPSGAAIRDILNVLGRRFDNLHVVLAPVRVQGAEAAADIVAAIEQLRRMGGLDVLIVGRGGGSLEDIWCFNEESVARAIAASEIPVISAVGHEIDFTISDFVADLRAPTPSAAAELVVGRKADFESRLDACSLSLRHAVRQRMLGMRNRLLAARGSRVFVEPGCVARRAMEKILLLQTRVERSVRDIVRERMQRSDEIRLRLERGAREMKLALEMNTQRLEARLSGMNPLAVLDRGYSITTRIDGEIVRRFDRVRQGERVLTRLAEGELESEVIRQNDIEKDKRSTEF